MTQVFVLMWLADVMGSVCFVGVVVLVGFLCAVLMSCFGLAIDEMENVVLAWRRARTVWISGLLVVLVAILVPSKQTLYVAAAAKAGEVAISTPTGIKAMQAINAVLDRVINSAKDKNESR